MFNQILTSYSLPPSPSLWHCIVCKYVTTPICVSSAHSSKVIMECRILQQYLLFVTPGPNDACSMSMKIVPNSKRYCSIVIFFSPQTLPRIIIIAVASFNFSMQKKKWKIVKAKTKFKIARDWLNFKQEICANPIIMIMIDWLYWLSNWKKECSSSI